MSSRAEILSRIRASLKVEANDPARIAAVAKRLRMHPAGYLPEPADPQVNEITRFRRKAEAAAATVAVTSRRNVASTVIQWLRSHNLPQQMRVGDDKRFQRIRWPEPGGPELLTGAAQPQDLVGLSYAFAAASESGTLFLTSGPESPTTINFLPENHIVILDARDIDVHYEAVWARLRRKYGESTMPRTVNLVTGPSRSADIEQTLILGAHGPMRLHIVIVKD